MLFCVSGEELLYVAGFVIVTDEDRHHNTAEDEHHIHIGVFTDRIDHIKGRICRNDIPSVCIKLFAALHTARADNHRRNDGRDGKEYVKERRMEQTVKVHAEHTLNSFCKAWRFKF